MGEVQVELELENAVDQELLRLGHITEEQRRSAKVQALVDSGAVMLVLPQDLVETLGLREVGKAIVTYADERDERKEERPSTSVLCTYAQGERKRRAQIRCRFVGWGTVHPCCEEGRRMRYTRESSGLWRH